MIAGEERENEKDVKGEQQERSKRNEDSTNQNCCLLQNNVNQFCNGLIRRPFVVYIKENIPPRHIHTYDALTFILAKRSTLL